MEYGHTTIFYQESQTVYYTVRVINIMSRRQPTSLESLVHRHQPLLQTIHNNAIAKSQRCVKDIYNRESRNINQFIRDHIAFQKLSKQKPVMFEEKSQINKRKRFGMTLRYEEDRSLQLEYLPVQQDKVKEPFTVGLPEGRSQSNQTSGFKTSKVSFHKGKNLVNACKLNLFPAATDSQTSFKARKHIQPMFSNPKPAYSRTRSPTISFNRTPNNRRRVATQFDQVSARQETSQAKKNQHHKNNSHAIIVMSRDKMERYIRSLHRVAWMAHYLRGKPEGASQRQSFKEHMRNFSLDVDAAIPQADLNYMVSRRYNLLNFHMEDHYQLRKKQLQQHSTSIQRQKLITGEQYSLLDSLSKHSILTIITKKIKEGVAPSAKQTISYDEDDYKEGQVHFSLPYAEFISQRQTKTSIYRLVSMSMVTCLRIAFSLYDKNCNGKVDEDDLLQAISLSRKMPQLQADILVIGSAMFAPRRQRSKSKQKRQSQKEGSQFVRSGHEKINVTFAGDKQLINSSGYDIGSTISGNKKQFQEASDQESENPATSSTKFSLDKFYIFLKQKSLEIKQPSPISQAQTVNSLTFSAFCRAFRNRRPAILYDLLQFIFGAQKEDFTSEALQQQQVSKDLKRPVKKVQESQEETLQQKWNSRLKNTNRILKNLVAVSQQL